MVAEPPNAKRFQEFLSENMYVVVDFYADWCGPCKAIEPIYKQLAKDCSLKDYLAFAKVNVDTNQQVAIDNGVKAMPTFMFFKEGKQVAVNAKVAIHGADVQSLKAAVEKLSGLAKAKQAAGVKIGD